MDLFPGTRGVTLNNPFVCCNRHRFNRVPGAHLGIAYVSAASLRWAEGEGKGWAEGEYRFEFARGGERVGKGGSIGLALL
jgi:hypothetical protein